MKVNDICRAVEMTAPLSYQESFDNSGLQAGLPSMEVGRVLVCLDVT